MSRSAKHVSSDESDDRTETGTGLIGFSLNKEGEGVGEDDGFEVCAGSTECVYEIVGIRLCVGDEEGVGLSLMIETAVMVDGVIDVVDGEYDGVVCPVQPGIITINRNRTIRSALDSINILFI